MRDERYRLFYFYARRNGGHELPRRKSHESPKKRRKATLHFHHHHKHHRQHSRQVPCNGQDFSDHVFRRKVAGTGTAGSGRRAGARRERARREKTTRAEAEQRRACHRGARFTRRRKVPRPPVRVSGITGSGGHHATHGTATGADRDRRIRDRAAGTSAGRVSSLGAAYRRQPAASCRRRHVALAARPTPTPCKREPLVF